MLQCKNTGHDGSMSNGACKPVQQICLSRLENMVLKGKESAASGDPVNQISKSGGGYYCAPGRIRDKSRKVLEITEVVGCENGEIRPESIVLL